MILWITAQFIVDAHLPQLFHGVPIFHDAMFDGEAEVVGRRGVGDGR